MSKIIGYCRVSTKGQLEGNSIEEQRKSIIERYSNAKIVEESYSGAKERKIFNEVLSSLEEGDTLVVTKLDRFCRSTKEGLEYIDKLMNKGVKIHILNMGLIEDTPMGRLIVTNLLAFAEFERAMIIERTQSGKAIAKQKKGFKEGRPKKHTIKQIDNALSMLTVNGGKYSYTEVAEITNISKSTLIRENNKRKLIGEEVK
jgi:DNA invertase Pin-like site-specific DNA recombinase